MVTQGDVRTHMHDYIIAALELQNLLLKVAPSMSSNEHPEFIDQCILFTLAIGTAFTVLRNIKTSAFYESLPIDESEPKA